MMKTNLFSTAVSNSQSVAAKSLLKPFQKYFFLLVFMLSSVGVWGQITEGFESGLPTSYIATTSYTLGSGTWTGQANGIIRGTTGVHAGTYSLQIRSQTGAQITSPNITAGVGIVSFYGTASTTGSVQVNYSTDGGGTWSAAPGSPFSLTTTKTLFSTTINDASPNILVQFYRTLATVYIDNVGITTYIAGKTSTGNGDWNTAGTWTPSGVPTASDVVTIRSSDIVYNNVAGLVRTAATNVNGGFQVQQGSWVDSGASGAVDFKYGSTGTLLFNNNSGSYGVNSTDKYWPTTDAPFNVSVINSGGITMNTARTVAGTFQTAATVTNPGNITIGTNGTLQLNAGYGFSGTGSPTYGSASLLKYNSGGSPGRSVEWNQTSGTIGSTAGYPNNVQISNNTTLNYANGGTATYKADKTVVIDAGSSLYQNYSGGNAGLAVGTDLTVNGNLTLGTTTGDLFVGGNFIVGTAGNFNPFGRAVNFIGIANQTITKTGGGTVGFDYITVNKSTGNLILSSSPATNISLNATSTDFLRLINTGSLDLNGRTLSLNNNGGGIYVNGARTITSSVAGGKIDINQYKYVANNAGTGSLTLDTNVIVNLNANGNFDFGKSSGVTITTLNGTLSINSTTSCYVNTNAPIYGNASTLIYNGVSPYGSGNEWTGNATTAGEGTPQNVILTSSLVNMPTSARSLAGNLTLGSGSTLNLNGTSGADLNIGGNWNNAGSFNPNVKAVFFRGTAVQTITGATIFDYLTINNAAGVILANSIINNFKLDFTSGKITLGANDLTNYGSIDNYDSSKYVVTNGTGQLKRTVGATDIIFPVGNTTYNPITFNNSGTSDTYGIKVVDGALTTALDNSKTIKRKWLVTEGTSGGSNLKVVGQYNTGEPDTNFNAGTTPKIGFYDGTNWTDVDATLAGANPFTLTSITNSSPANMTSGTQYFALGKDNAFTTKATKYVITAISPTSPGAGYPFNVTVQAQDAYGFAANVSANSTFTLTTNGLAGAIGGTVSGTILSGTNSIVVTGVTLATAGTGVTVTATNSSGLSLTTGVSATFTVLAKASKLAFVGVPATGSVAVNLTAFTVEARRPDNSIDTFYTGSITIAKASGSGALSGALAPAAVAGVATFSDAQFNAADTYTLTTTASGLTSDTSGNIVVTVSTFTTGDYRTNPSFAGSIFFASTTAVSGVYPWQKWNGGSWIDVTGSSATASPQSLATKPDNIYLNNGDVDLAAGSTYNNIIVEGGYVYSGNTTTGLTIAANKTLDIKAGTVYIDGKLSMSAGSTIVVREDALFEIASSSSIFTRNATSNLTVEDGGFLAIDNYLANIWTGNENFAGLSYVGVYGWDRTAKFFDAATDITDNAAGSKFGYLDLDLGISGITGNWTYVFPSSGTYSLTNKDFYLTNSTSHNVTLNPGTMEIGGDFKVYGTGNIHGKNQTGSKIFNVNGNFEKNGNGEFRLNTGTDTANPVELNVDGNFTVNAGTFVIDNGATTNLTSKVNLKGNLYKAASSYMTNSNTNSALVTFNFKGNSAQTVDLTVGAVDDMLRYNFYIKNGAYVKPVTQDWKLATNSKLIVESGGTLDFSFNGATPYNVITNGAQVGMTFNAQSGGIVKVTSPDGLNTVAPRSSLGNVQTPVAGRTFDAGAIYHYIGKSATPQVTGNGIATSALPLTGKIIVEMETTAGAFSAYDSRTINGTGTLEIKKGIVTDDTTNGFIGSGKLLMESADGRYITSRATLVPDLTGTYTLTNGTIEFANKSSTTAIRVAPRYYNVDISGDDIITGGKDFFVKNVLQVTKSTSVFTVPEVTLDSDTPNVVTATNGIKVLAGKAIFKNNAILMQDIDAANYGEISMERKANVPAIQYNYWSSPVKEQALYSLYSGIPTNTVMVYNSLNDRFTILPTASNPLSVFAKGYSIKGTGVGPLTGVFKGEPNNETALGINTITLSTAGSNYNLIGNPYPSNLNILSLYGDSDNTGKFYNEPTGSDIETPTAYFWDNKSNTRTTQEGSTYGQSNYAILNLSSGVGTAAPGGTAGKKPNGIVKPGQGFIIRAAEAGGSLTFKNTFRTVDVKPSGGTDGVYYKNAAETIDKFWLTLTTANNINLNIALAYNINADDAFERFDSTIYNEAVTENFYSLSSDAKKLAIQSRKGDFSTEDKIPLGIKTSNTGIQKISIDEKYGVFESQPIYLKDKALNIVTNLFEGAYEFTSVNGVDQNRFEIIYKPEAVLVTGSSTKEQLAVYSDGQDFIVQSSSKLIDEVEVFDVSGRLMQKVKGNSTKVLIDGNALVSGVYLLKIKRNKEIISKKIIK